MCIRDRYWTCYHKLRVKLLLHMQISPFEIYARARACVCLCVYGQILCSALTWREVTGTTQVLQELNKSHNESNKADYCAQLWLVYMIRAHTQSAKHCNIVLWQLLNRHQNVLRKGFWKYCETCKWFIFCMGITCVRGLLVFWPVVCFSQVSALISERAVKWRSSKYGR